MEFDKKAYFFDTMPIHKEQRSYVYCVSSFVSNPAYISAFAEESLSGVELPSSDSGDLEQWILDDKNMAIVVPLLMKIWDNKEKLGIVAYFIEREYAKFVYLMGLLCYRLDVNEASFKSLLDKLYKDYLSSFEEWKVDDDAEKKMTDFSDFVSRLLSKNEYSHYRNLLKDNIRPADEIKKIVQLLNSENFNPFTMSDYYVYAKRLIEVYKENAAQQIYVTRDNEERLSDSIRFYGKEYSPNLVLSDNSDDSVKNIATLIRVVLAKADQVFNKVASATKLDDISDTDKNIFVIYWSLFQSDQGSWFFNSKIFATISELLNSLRKEYSV